MAVSSGRWSPSGAMVGLLALGLGVENLAARDNALMPLMWLHAVVPGADLRLAAARTALFPADTPPCGASAA